jgi:hypothetical protein
MILMLVLYHLFLLWKKENGDKRIDWMKVKVLSINVVWPNKSKRDLRKE